MKAIKALGETVIVESPDNKEKVTDSGIILTANTDKETRHQGVVVSVGEKVEGIQVGDTVLISRMGMAEAIQLNGKFLLVLPKNEIYAVITEAN